MSKNIVLGVTGGIAAYKSISLASLLVKGGYNVWVVMTASAMQFVTPLTFQTITKNDVYYDTFVENDAKVVAHIDIADKADLVLIAPATANIIGKIASGIADDMLTTIMLATTAPVMIAPAMNVHMYSHPAVKKNMQTLQQWGYHFIDAADGPLACGYTGKGRLEEPDKIFDGIEKYFTGNLPTLLSPNPDPFLEQRKSGIELSHDLKGKTVLITAGPTQEAIDPVRYITNRSSGKMGYALAEACTQRGAHVVLVSGKTHISPPAGVELFSVTTAEQMAEVVLKHLHRANWVIGTAAVADYKPKLVHTQKMKKSSEHFELELVKTIDILHMVGQKRTENQTIIGFAAETEQLLVHAEKKLKAKNLDYVVVNDVSVAGIGFDSDQNEVIILSKQGKKFTLPKTNKIDIANQIITAILADMRDI